VGAENALDIAFLYDRRSITTTVSNGARVRLPIPLPTVMLVDTTFQQDRHHQIDEIL
jgi:hypothetical protein